MIDAELIDRVENAHVREFLHEYLDEYVSDVLVFSEQILAHVPSESKSFVKSAGLAFYSTAIISFVPDLPWQTIKTEIANAVSEVFQTNMNDQGRHEKEASDPLDQDHTEVGFIQRAIVTAFASVCKAAEDAMGAILIGDLAQLLGKYIALFIAWKIDEAVEFKSYPIVLVPPPHSD
ncbi:MAG: hypothetical protein JXM79_04765 [Sedimentisphaerales bacterium]|nr:hypothetical protein [Sedimentisphaerales bacterium]